MFISDVQWCQAALDLALLTKFKVIDRLYLNLPFGQTFWQDQITKTETVSRHITNLKISLWYFYFVTDSELEVLAEDLSKCFTNNYIYNRLLSNVYF